MFRPSNFRTVSTGNNLSSGFAAISHPLFPFFSVQGNQPSTSQYPSSGLTGHYPYTIYFFALFSFSSFFLTHATTFFLAQAFSTILFFLFFCFFSLPENGTEIGRKHRQMLKAVCLTLQQQTRFNISRCFRATSTLFLHSSVLHHSLSFFLFLTFLVLHSIFLRCGRVGRKYRQILETVWASLFSAKMYTGVQAWVHMFFLGAYFFCCRHALSYHRMYIHAYILLDALRQLALPPGYLCIRLYVYPVLLFIFLCIPLFAILFNIILFLCTPYYTDKIFCTYLFTFFYLCFKQKNAYLY